MPELPDLEVHCKNLIKVLNGEVVQNFCVLRPKRVHPSETAITDALRAAKLSGFRREGKEVRIQFSNGHCLGVHLMLNGEFSVTSLPERARFSTAELEFQSGTLLSFTDKQAWITISLDPETPAVPDALSKEFTLEYFKTSVHARGRVPVKMILVDQDIVRGIGNAYSDEILWHARVDPQSIGNTLPPAVVSTLYHQIGHVLQKAIRDLDNKHPGLTAGEPRDILAVHNTGRDCSPTGAQIFKKQVKGKTTYFTSEQILYQ